MGELIAPSVPSYMCSVLISAIPKIFLILAACAVAAYRAELFFAYEIEGIATKRNISIDHNLPTNICWHIEDGGNYRGDRLCNNAMGAAVITVIIAVMLLIIDMIVPCLSAGYVRLATLFTILWSVLTAAHWLVTGALLADLYRRYCNHLANKDCNEDDRRFTVLIVMSFVCAGGWGVVVLHSLVRLCCGRSESSSNDKTYAT